MWEGVPPGGSLMRRYKPGETRHFMNYEGGDFPLAAARLPPDEAPEAT